MVALVTVTVNHFLLNGSVPRGYEWLVACPSLAHENVKDPSLTITLSPVENPWAAEVTTVNTPVVGLYAVPVVAVWAVGGVNPWEDLVTTKSPVAGLYVAPVGWKALPVLGLTAVAVADTNLCSYWAPGVRVLFLITSTARFAACLNAKIDSCSSPVTWSSVTYRFAVSTVLSLPPYLRFHSTDLRTSLISSIQSWLLYADWPTLMVKVLLSTLVEVKVAPKAGSPDLG